MRIGVTSQNFRTITAHGGRARRFVIFEDFPDGQIQETGKLDLPMEMSIHGYPRDAAHPIDSIDVLITASCGDGFARKLGERGIRVVVTSETDPIAAVKAVLSGAPLPPAPEEEDHAGCGCNCSGGGNH
jgi:predicted Fe-Mo cluster-binding NifX family protein